MGLFCAFSSYSIDIKSISCIGFVLPHLSLQGQFAASSFGFLVSDFLFPVANFSFQFPVSRIQNRHHDKLTMEARTLSSIILAWMSSLAGPILGSAGILPAESWNSSSALSREHEEDDRFPSRGQGEAGNARSGDEKRAPGGVVLPIVLGAHYWTSCPGSKTGPG